MAAVADSTSFNKPGYARDVARRLGLTGFGHWWARELAALGREPTIGDVAWPGRS